MVGLLSAASIATAETKIQAFEYSLSDDEKAVDVYGNTDSYAITIEKTIKGVVPRKEYWLQTKGGKFGPFSYPVRVLWASDYPIAMWKDESGYKITYGPPVDGTLKGAIAELPWYDNLRSNELLEFCRSEKSVKIEDQILIPGQMAISDDFKQFAVVVKSAKNVGKYDIIINGKVFDYFSLACLIGFNGNGDLVFWAAKSSNGTHRWDATLYYGKEVATSVKSALSLPEVYLDSARNIFGWAEGNILETGYFKALRFVYIVGGGKKTIALKDATNISFITSDGHVLHNRDSHQANDLISSDNSLYLDGVFTGIVGEVFAVSPNGKRVVIRTADNELLLDGEVVLVGKSRDVYGFFTQDSEHFIAFYERDPRIRVPATLDGFSWEKIPDELLPIKEAVDEWQKKIKELTGNMRNIVQESITLSPDANYVWLYGTPDSLGEYSWSFRTAASIGMPDDMRFFGRFMPYNPIGMVLRKENRVELYTWDYYPGMGMRLFSLNIF